MKYPHLLPEEVILWERFLSSPMNTFFRFDYDFHVGEGWPLPDEKDLKYSAAWKTLTQKRIDVIGYKDDEVYLFEVRPSADCQMLGKLLAYEFLFERDVMPGKDIKLVLVTDRLSPDDMNVFLDNDITVFIV